MRTFWSGRGPATTARRAGPAPPGRYHAPKCPRRRRHIGDASRRWSRAATAPGLAFAERSARPCGLLLAGCPRQGCGVPPVRQTTHGTDMRPSAGIGRGWGRMDGTCHHGLALPCPRMWEGHRVPRLFEALLECGRGTVCRDFLDGLFWGGGGLQAQGNGRRRVAPHGAPPTLPICRLLPRATRIALTALRFAFHPITIPSLRLCSGPSAFHHS